MKSIAVHLAAPACCCLLLLAAGCSRPASSSYLENGTELLAMTRDSSSRGLAAAFILWCTDSAATPSATVPATNLNTEALGALRRDVASPARPSSARVEYSDSACALVSFDRAADVRERMLFWMKLTMENRRIVGAELIAVPDQYDIYDMEETALEKLRAILVSGETEGAGRKAVRRLDPETFGSLRAVRATLAESYSGRAVEAIMQSLGMYERDNLVWMPAKERPAERLWSRAEIAAVTAEGRGFVARFDMPSRDGESTDTAEIPFILTPDGWRIDEAIFP
jgi:hypothetical protein